MYSTPFRTCVDGPSNAFHFIPHLRGRSFQCIPLHSALAWTVLPMCSDVFRFVASSGLPPGPPPRISAAGPPPPGNPRREIASPRISSPLPSHTVRATQCGPPHPSAAGVQRTPAPLQPHRTERGPPLSTPRLASPASQKLRDRDRYRVSGSLRDRKDRASPPPRGSPRGGGTPDPGGEGRIGCETVMRTRDPGSRDRARSDRWTPCPTRP